MLYDNYQEQTLQIGGLNVILAYNLSMQTLQTIEKTIRIIARFLLSFRLSLQGSLMLCQSMEIWQLVQQDNRPQEPLQDKEPQEPDEPQEPENHENHEQEPR